MHFPNVRIHLLVVLQLHVVEFFSFHAYSAHDGIWSRYFDFHVWIDILFMRCILHSRVQMEIEVDAGHSDMLIAAASVSDQSVFLVAHWGESFGPRSSSAMRCGEAFWLLVSRSTASMVLKLLCSCGKIIRRPRGAAATPIGAAATDEQIVPRCFSRVIVCRDCRCVQAGFLGS